MHHKKSMQVRPAPLYTTLETRSGIPNMVCSNGKIAGCVDAFVQPRAGTFLTIANYSPRISYGVSQFDGIKEGDFYGTVNGYLHFDVPVQMEQAIIVPFNVSRGPGPWKGYPNTHESFEIRRMDAWAKITLMTVDWIPSEVGTFFTRDGNGSFINEAGTYTIDGFGTVEYPGIAEGCVTWNNQPDPEDSPWIRIDIDGTSEVFTNQAGQGSFFGGHVMFIPDGRVFYGLKLEANCAAPYKEQTCSTGSIGVENCFMEPSVGMTVAGISNPGFVYCIT
jgi:hypothetical protein